MAHLIKTSSHKRTWWIVLKTAILLCLTIFIYLKLSKHDNVGSDTWDNIKTVIVGHYQLLMLVVAMMPVNWTLEALKWQSLATPIARMSFLHAFEGVLTGLCLSFITPHGIGDYIGRIMQDQHRDRGRYVGAIMLGRFCQMIPTLVFGLIGGFYLLSGKTMLIGILVLLLTGFLVYLIVTAQLKPKQKNHLSWVSRLAYYLGVITEYSSGRLLKVISLSFLRYIVFAIQFVVIIHLFLPELSFSINMAGVTWIFLFKSVLPTFNFLSDLGIREFSAIYFFEQFNTDVVAVVNASLTIWMINILVPTIMGAPLVLKMKLKAQ